MTFSDLLLAQAAPPATTPQQSIFSTLSMMAIIFLIFYFLLIRPQQRQLKEQRKLLDSLQKGDNVVTTGGLYGRIIEVGEKVLTVEIAEKVKVKINRDAVAGVVRPEVQVIEPEKK